MHALICLALRDPVTIFMRSHLCTAHHEPMASYCSLVSARCGETYVPVPIYTRQQLESCSSTLHALAVYNAIQY